MVQSLVWEKVAKTYLQTARQVSMCFFGQPDMPRARQSFPLSLHTPLEWILQHCVSAFRSFLLGPKLRFAIHVTISLKHPALAQLGVTWALKMIPE